MVFYVAMVTFLMKLLMNEFTSFVMDDWNLDEKSLIKWQYLQKYVNFFFKKWQIMLGLHVVSVHYMCGLQLVLSKINRIGDTKYNI